MEYLNALINRNKIHQKYVLKVFFHCAEIIPPHYDNNEILINKDQVGVMHAPHGYFLPNVYAMFECWPSVIKALKYAMPNLHIQCYGVCNKMLAINENGIAGYQNPIQLLSPRPFQNASFINKHYAYYNELKSNLSLYDHWDIEFKNQFVPVTHNAIIYAAPYSGDHKDIIHYTKTLEKMECQSARIIDSPKYMSKILKETYSYKTAKSLAERFMPDFYPKTLNCNDINKACRFLKTHRHIVLKPPHLVGGDEVYFFDLNHKTRQQVTLILQEFRKTFHTLLHSTLKAGFNQLILQKFIDGILEHGETRIYIMGGKILPVGIQMYGQDADKAFKPEKGAKSRDIILDEAYLNVAKTFIDRVHPKLDFFYYGLDVIKQTFPDGTHHYYILEANYGTVGFFPRIAETIKRRYAEIKNHIKNLPEIYHNYVEINYIDSLVYQPIYQHLFARKKEIHLIYPDNVYGPQTNDLISLYVQQRLKSQESHLRLYEERCFLLQEYENDHKKLIHSKLEQAEKTATHIKQAAKKALHSKTSLQKKRK
ncbi:MAG: glutathione synthase/RimK-type ligase-like ATP-grasp enzyme [Alphaproteobacteria bacterium]